MEQENADPKKTLRERFPDMEPIESVPGLGRINGIGFSVYGKRDYDVETGTYVKTYCFCVLFIPLIPISAYRVADADRGWYFLGKVPLSSFARSWNWGLLAAALLFSAGLGLHSYTTSPQFVARQELKQADADLKSGAAVKAAGEYRKLLSGEFYAAEARAGFQSAAEEGLKLDSPAKISTLYRLIAGLPANANQPTPLVPDAFKRGLELVNQFSSKDPEGALALLRDVAPLQPKDPTLPAREIDLLKKSIAAHPANTNRVVELAVIYEKAGQKEENIKLLTPYKTRLGDTEGARILGQELLSEGQYDDAYSLLFPYVQRRLDQLHQVERAYTNAMQSASSAALNELKEGRGDSAFYVNYKQANKTEKEAMVDDYISKHVERDPAYQRAVAELRNAAKIVNVTLDLGIVQLNRAQNLSEPDARKKELEAAEKTFLAIRSFAGGSDEYRLFLGQVYYWLGKSQEGKELFDQLLASKKRSYTILMSLAKTLRDVGDHNGARALTEEAYQTGKTIKEKEYAAALRAHIQKDVDDQIAWLEKSDQSDPSIQISLFNSKGDKALQEGNKIAAADFIRKAINGYNSMSKNSITLNNCALCYLTLYEISGDIHDHDRGLAMMEEAIALDPGNSVTIQNTVHILISRAALDLLQGTINVELLHETPSLDMLRHLYNTEAEYHAVFQRLSANEHLKKALVYLDKALLLAPKSVSLYSTSLEIQESFDNLEEMQKLQRRFTVAQIDQTDSWKEYVQAYRGLKDKEYTGKMTAGITRYETLMQSPEVAKDPLTREVAVTEWANTLQNASVYGAKVDSKRILSESLAAYQKHPSSGSRGSLLAAYFFQANVELAASNPEYAGLTRQAAHAVSPYYLIALLLERGGSLSQAIRQNENVVKGMALEKETGKAMPSYRQPAEWAMFRNTDPNEAAVVSQAIKANESTRLSQEVNFQILPMSAQNVLNEYWIKQLMGDEKAAQAVYQEALAKGIPLPSL